MTKVENNKLLLRDSDWQQIAGKICRVVRLIPLSGRVENGKVVEVLDKSMPYATIALESHEWGGKISGSIINKTDFLNLWEAFREVHRDEDVLIVWSLGRKYFWARPLSVFLPRLTIMVLPKNLYEILPPDELPNSFARKVWPKVQI